MNKNIYQVIWNSNLGQWVVTSELTKRGKKRGGIGKKAIACSLLMLNAGLSFALPTGHETVAGQVAISSPAAGQMQIDQASEKAIINWQGFSIDPREAVNINLPNASSVQLNRIVGQDPSVIQGQLNSNGNVYLVNPNGVVFSKTAQVDVGGLIASTRAISNEDFLKGNPHFTEDSAATGQIINEGQIKTPAGSVVALIGEQVENAGSIETPQGSTVLAAGKTVDLDMKGDGLVEVKVSEAALQAQVANHGLIRADGGQVVLMAQSASELLKTVVNNDGVIEAHGFAEKNGVIVLSGGNEGVVEVGGIVDVSNHASDGNPAQGGNVTVTGQQIQVDANAVVKADTERSDRAGNVTLQAEQDIHLSEGSRLSADNRQGDGGAIRIDSQTGTTLTAASLSAQSGQAGKGGEIALLGSRVGVLNQGNIDASGHRGGGKVLIGGDYQGKSPDLHHAEATYIGADATIKADAKSDGDGGQIIVWSDQATKAHGRISAKGGSSSGNGGLIETSGHWLDTTGITIDASASNGKNGTWLLDPYDITIDNTGTTTAGPSFPNWTANADSSVILNSDINNVLDTGTSVQIWTGGTAGTQTGNITVAANIDKIDGTDTTLTLMADNAIIINRAVGITSSFNRLNVVLNADADGNGAGNIQMQAGSAITSNGGNIVMGGGVCTLSNCSLAASGYDVQSQPNGFLSQSTSNGILLDGASSSPVTLNSVGPGGADGSISMQGHGIDDAATGSSTASHTGINAFYLDVNSGTASIDMLGTGGVGIDYSRGISLQTSTLVTTGGALTLTGTGSTTASGTENNGISLFSTTLNSGSADMTLNGTGGSGVSSNYGVYVGVDSTTFTPSTLTTTGALSLVGTGGNGSGTANAGIGLESAHLNAGTLDLQGTGGTGTDRNQGITSWAYVDLAGSQLTSTGLMTLTGTGSSLVTGIENNGIDLFSATLNSGNADMRLNGTGGNGTSDNYGVHISVDSGALTKSTLTSSNGLTITGTGGSGGGGHNIGIELASAVLTAGNMSITGTGGGGSSVGIDIWTSSLLSSTDMSQLIVNNGDLLLSGSSTSSYGLWIETDSQLANNFASGVTTLEATTTTGSDSILLDPSAVLSGMGTLKLLPGNVGASIGLAGGTGIFNLDSTELATISSGFSNIIIGDINLGSSVNVGAWSIPGLANFTLFGTGGITQFGALTVGSGKELSLVAGSSYNNTFGSAALNVSGGGRWLVYANNPASVSKNGLTSDFRQYNTNYADTITGVGNGFIYASAPGALLVNTTLASGVASNTYGSNPTAVFGYTIGNPSIADNEDLALTAGTASFTPTITNATSAGTYHVAYLSGLSNPAGYSFIAGTTLAYTVDPATLSAVGQQAYNGTLNFAGGNLTINGVNGESFTATGNGTLGTADVQSNQALTDVAGLTLAPVGGASLGNYQPFSTAQTSVSVTPAILTALGSQVYDGTLNFAGGNLTVSGVNGESFTATGNGTLGTANVQSNQALADVTGLTLAPVGGASLGNYQPFSTAQTSISVTPAILSALGSQVYNGTLNFAGGNLTVSGVNGESFTATGNGTLGTANVQSNQALASVAGLTLAPVGGASLGNYQSFTTAQTSVSVTPASLIVTANGANKIYDGFPYSGGNGVTFAGFVNNESATVLSGAITYGGNSQGAIRVGQYDILPSGFSSNNYSISYVGGTLNIQLADPTGAIDGNVTALVTSNVFINPIIVLPAQQAAVALADSLGTPENSGAAVIRDLTSEFTGNISNNLVPAVFAEGQTAQPVLFKPTLRVKNATGGIKLMRMDEQDQYLSLLLDNDEVRVWDFQLGVQREIDKHNIKLSLADISAVNDKGELLSVANVAGVGSYDLIGSYLSDQVPIQAPDTQHFAASKDGNFLLVSSGPDRLAFWNNTQDKRLWDMAYPRGIIHALAMSGDNRLGAVVSRQAGSLVLPRNLDVRTVTDAVDIVDLNSGQIIKSLPNFGEQIVYLNFKNNDALLLGFGNGEVLEWPIGTSKPVTLANFNEAISDLDVSQDKYAYVLNDGTVRVSSGESIQLSLENEKNPFKFAMLLENGSKLVTAMKSGEISVWDVASGMKILRLFSTKQGWTAMDAYGRFDSSEDALENFTWNANEEDIPLDSFSDNYYEPGLVSSVLRDQDFLNQNSTRVNDGISLPPKVTLALTEQTAASQSVTLSADVFDRGGGIDAIHIYHNGKLLNDEDVITSQQTWHPDEGAEHIALALRLSPSSGRNSVKVVASNNMGIEGSSSELVFDGDTKAPFSPIHLLTVGIDKYSDEALDLDYSVADANVIGHAIKSGAKIEVAKSLYNENATKPRILAELKELSRGNQEDILIVYFAGHGLSIGKEWYFLPYETKMQPTVEQIAETAITATELSDIFKDAKAQHILVLIDSCYSGAAMDSFNKLQIGQHYFTRKLSRSLGITMITSASKDKEAYELKSLGHGLFSYLMAKDIQDKNTTNTAHSVAENIMKTLPGFSKKMVGVIQEPVVYTKGNDFMLTDLDQEAKK